MQELIDDFQRDLGTCDDIESALRIGRPVLSLPYCDSIIRRCWPIFEKRIHEIAPNRKPESIAILDLSGVFHACWSIDEEEAQAMTLRKIESLCKFAICNHFVIAVDSDTSWRKEEYPEYKATRDRKPASFYELRKRTIDAASLAYPIASVDHHEADDVIASLVFSAKLLRNSVTVISEDKDMWQCLGNGTCIYAHRSDEYRTDEWLESNHGINVKQVVDYLCITGKDNIPKPSGLGKAFAQDNLGKFGSFAGIVEAAGQLTEDKRKKLFEFAPKYWQASRLHSLKKHLDVFWS